MTTVNVSTKGVGLVKWEVGQLHRKLCRFFRAKLAQPKKLPNGHKIPLPDGVSVNVYKGGVAVLQGNPNSVFRTEINKIIQGQGRAEKAERELQRELLKMQREDDLFLI